ncbi:hypothetical protein DFH05DRAFT_1249874 [Lentinula detonsa]|uniref:Uncharacterized protein n=1 Tax=Lentinula detonsa TaxID=2804962 RepID=A0A9W8TWW8_9AGAR|nr:hypothetical protein DFH05DRAFT_1249874 [Lentinula detonsa]
MTRGQKLSDNLQNTLIHLRKTCKTLNEIVEKSNCKKRTIQRVLSHHRKKDQNHLGIGIELKVRKRIISFEDLQFIHGLLLHTPDMYLDEIQHHLDERRGVLAAVSTIWKVLKCSGYTLKKVYCPFFYHRTSNTF